MAHSPFLIVAIDGGAGDDDRSARAPSRAARFPPAHADTGSYYRAVTAGMLSHGVKPGGPRGSEGGADRSAAHDAGRGPIGAHGDRRPGARR